MACSKRSTCGPRTQLLIRQHRRHGRAHGSADLGVLRAEIEERYAHDGVSGPTEGPLPSGSEERCRHRVWMASLPRRGPIGTLPRTPMAKKPSRAAGRIRRVVPHPRPGRRRRGRSRRVRRLPRGQRGSPAGRSAAQLPAADHDAGLRRRRHDARRVLRRAPLPGAARPRAEPRAARLPRRRGRGLLPPPGHRSVRHRARALRQPGQQARRAGRQHDHAAGREDAAAHPRAQPRAQGEGGHPVAAPREEAHQGRHPLSVPEPDLLRRRRLRRRGRRARRSSTSTSRT